MSSTARFKLYLAKLCGFAAILLPLQTALAQTQTAPDTGVYNALDIGDCPNTAKDLPTDKVFLCTCPGFILAEWAGSNHPGRVWGTLIYAKDSFICNAAIHAGVLKKGKGGVSL